MSLSIGVGGDIDYYERGADNEHVRDSEQHHDVHAERARSADYYTGDVEAGRELEGRWIGPGAEALGLSGNVNSWQLHKLYGEHIDPVTKVELGSRPRKFTTPAERLAARLAKEPFATEARKREIELSVSPKTPHTRNFLDLTFSVPKSYSVLYAALTAAGRDEDAQKLMAAHHRAIDECMKVLMDEAGYSRTGHHGRKVAGISTGQRIEAHDFVYSIFDHRLSRCGDPQVHSHVLLLNKVECADGQWRTLDTDVIVRQMQRSVGALHERFLAEETARTMGLSHRPRVDGFGWEVEGIEQADMDLYSTRRRAIDPVAADMTAKFVAKFNREPNARERDSIQQAATLATRPAKAHDLTFEQYVETWIDRYATERDAHLADLLDRVPMGEGREVPAHGAWDRSEVVKMAIARCEAKNPTWTRPQLRQAISDLLPPNLGRASADELLPYLDSIVDEAIGSERVVVLSQSAAVEAPTSLRHENGHSVYEPFHVERFTTDARLMDERRLAGLAQRTDGPRLTDQDAHRLIIETTLYPDQARVAHDVLTSGRRLTFLEARAGTGKSYTIGKVAQLWDFGVGGKVIGLAKSQAATGVLTDEGLKRAYNFATFKRAHEMMPDSGPGRATSMERYGVTPNTLIIVDEVSTLDDADRFWLEDFAREHGVTMLWVGDRGQVGAVGADGGLDVLAAAVPPLELDVARRFANAWEGPASLDLHDGKLSAIVEYDTHGRVVTGTREEMNAQAVDQLVVDLTRGHNSLLMVPTNELAAQFSSEVRQRLIALGLVDAGKTLPLRDHNKVSPGDVIQARETKRQIPGAPEGEGISNRDVFRVEAFGPAGSLVVRQHLGHDGGPVFGPERVLPADYVREQVELAYAMTVDSKIGRTVENGYQLITDASDWNKVYTGATRGRYLNVMFVPVEHEDGVPVETGVQVLARIAERRSVELSATEAQRQELDAVTHLGRLGPIYENELAKHARQHQQDLFERVLPPEYAAALATDESAPALYRLTHALEREGHDVEQVVRAAVERRELGSADSISQVLHWRITHEAGPVAPRDVTSGRERYVEAVPAGDTPELNHLRQVAEVMDHRVGMLGYEQLEAPEPWATKHIGAVPDDPIERLQWSEKAGQVAAYREQYGVTDPENAIGEAPGRAAAEQRAAWEGAYVALGRPAENEDVARRSEGELLLNVDQYKRIEAWMPPDVSEQLKTTSIAARNYATQAELDRTKGDVAAAERSERMAARMEGSAVKFEQVAEARKLAEDFTTVERETANASQRELDRRRGHDQPEPEVRQPEPEQPQQRQFTIDDALDRARQVTREIEAERAIQEEQRRIEQQQQQQSYDQSNEHGYDY